MLVVERMKLTTYDGFCFFSLSRTFDIGGKKLMFLFRDQTCKRHIWCQEPYDLPHRLRELVKRAKSEREPGERSNRRVVVVGAK